MPTQKRTEKVIGTRAIGAYLGRSIGSVMNYQKLQNLPIFQIGGVWEASKKDLEDWKECQRNGEWYERKEKKTRKKT
mgnify:CR=1 FL=1